MTDLLLINPGGRGTIYQNLGEDLTGEEQPLWCRIIAGYVRDRGYDVMILDAEAVNLSTEAVVKHVISLSPKLIGLVVS